MKNILTADMYQQPDLFGHPISRQMLQQADGRDCVWTVNRIGETIENFIRAFTEYYKGNENIAAFDVFHEPTEEPSQQYYQNEWRELVYCYCEHSKEKFRTWLKDKYKTLEKTE